MPRDNASLLALCPLLLPDDRSLVDDVWLAIQDPQAYLEQFDPSGRGIRSAVPALPWIALVDGLAVRQRLVETRYHDVDVLEDGLRQHLVQSQLVDYQGWPAEAELTPLGTEAVLKLFAEFYMRQGWVLAHFDINSDTWVLSLVEAEKLSLIRSLASNAGYGTIIPVVELLKDDH